MGLFSSIGKMFNDITGATSAAQQQYGYQKEFMQNAHQWEVADLEKSGLNPILSADGSGAQGNAAAVGTGSFNPVGLITSLLDYSNRNEANQIAQQDTDAKTALATAEKEKTEAETTGKILENKYIDPEKKAEIANKWAQTENLNKNSELTSAKTATEAYNKYNAQQDWYKKNEEIQEIFWRNFNNKSEAEFVQNYGMTKDQALELYKTTGEIIGSIIPKTNKVNYNTGKTSAKKPYNPRIAIDKKG